MNVFTFKPRFEAPVLAGIKTHTLRAHRADGKPRAVVGERLSLRVWAGQPYRSRQREFAQAVVERVESFAMQDTGRELLVSVGGSQLRLEELNQFARADGFRSMLEMADWFSREHSLPFKGVLIGWTMNDGGQR